MDKAILVFMKWLVFLQKLVPQKVYMLHNLNRSD